MMGSASSSDFFPGRRLRVDGSGTETHDLARGCRVRSVRGQDLDLTVLALHLLHPILCSGHATHLTHAVHLIAYNLTPIGAILIGLNHRDIVGVLFIEHERGTSPLVIDHRNFAILQLIAADNHAERRQRSRVVLDDHSIVYTEYRTILHVPPAHLIWVGEVPVFVGVDCAIRVHNVAPIILLWDICREPQIMVVVLMFVCKCHRGARCGPIFHGVDHIRIDDALVRIGHSCVQTKFATLFVIDGADLKPLGVSTKHPGLATTIA
mmetsp:Transcript_49442/g.124520  ORF Transcript_49442/g.124520 Transcript_49442/m.124520 type:complete len:265 (+) Transcript_49442:256-1050(+)